MVRYSSWFGTEPSSNTLSVVSFGILGELKLSLQLWWNAPDFVAWRTLDRLELEVAGIYYVLWFGLLLLFFPYFIIFAIASEVRMDEEMLDFNALWLPPG
jgi:hypothetical protein